MDYQELIEQLRKAVISPFDLGPVADAIESLLNALDVAEGEVKRTAAERDAALAELAKYRDAPIVGWQWLNTGTYRKNIKNAALYRDWQPLIIKPDENQ